MKHPTAPRKRQSNQVLNTKICLLIFIFLHTATSFTLFYLSVFLDTLNTTSMPNMNDTFRPIPSDIAMSTRLPPLNLPTSQNYPIMKSDVEGHYSISDNIDKERNENLFEASSSSRHKLQNLRLEQRSPFSSPVSASSSGLPEFAPSSSSAYPKEDTRKYFEQAREERSSEDEQHHNIAGLIESSGTVSSELHNNLMSSQSLRGQHPFLLEHKLPSLLDCNQARDNGLLAPGGPYKVPAADTLMSSLAFGYPTSTSDIQQSGFTNVGMNAFASLSSRKLPPEGNEVSSSQLVVSSPHTLNEHLPPSSPTIDIVQTSPTLQSSPSLSTEYRLSPSTPQTQKLPKDRAQIPYTYPRDLLNNTLSTTTTLKAQNQQLSLVSPSSLHSLTQNIMQVNSNPAMLSPTNTFPNFSSSSELERSAHLHPSEVTPSAVAQPVSTSSAYPYFTSPNADLSSQYYGSYSSADGLFTSKNLHPSKSRSLKSRSHAGKIDHMSIHNNSGGFGHSFRIFIALYVITL